MIVVCYQFVGRGAAAWAGGEGQPYITLEPTTINHVNAI